MDIKVEASSYIIQTNEYIFNLFNAFTSVCIAVLSLMLRAQLIGSKTELVAPPFLSYRDFVYELWIYM